MRLTDEIHKIPGAVDVRVQQPDNFTQFQISVDRAKAAVEFGLTGPKRGELGPPEPERQQPGTAGILAQSRTSGYNT